MQIYKFRILLEDQDNFLRDIEIKPNQTFEDFHKIILKSNDINSKELASFYICDREWDKLEEITLIDMMTDDVKENNDESEANSSINVMSNSKLKDFIKDTHQRLIYQYDFLNPHTFYLELIKTVSSKQNVKYPRCIKRKGKIQKNNNDTYSDKDHHISDKLLNDFNEMLKDSYDYEGENY